MVVKKIYICWDMAPCSPLKVSRRSSETSIDSLQATRRYIQKDITLERRIKDKERRNNNNNTCNNFEVLFRERTMKTERPSLVGEVIANSWGLRVPRGQCD
jgi:hypothetical protein